jgi:hypothetical protein
MSPRFNGTAIDPYHTRLFQNSASTRLLQSLLLAVILCLLASAFLIDTKKVLQPNPCSIARMMALLADSELLLLNDEDDDDGGRVAMPPSDDEAQAMTKEQLKHWCEDGGWRFRLGWFGGGEGVRRRYRLGVVDRDEGVRGLKARRRPGNV